MSARAALLVVLVGLALAAPAEVDRSRPPPPAPPPAIAFPAHETRTLANGLQVFFVRSTREPMVTFRMVVKAGAARDQGKSGLAALLATLLSHGTARRDAAQFAEDLDFLGARFEAGASEDVVYALAQGLSRHTDRVLDLFADAILHPLLPAEEIALEKRKMLSALESERQEPGALAGRLRDRLVFGAHPYGQSPTPASVEAIDRDDLTGFHARYFAPNNATLAVVGDFDLATLLPAIEAAFANWKPLEVAALPPPPPVPATGTTVHLVDRPGSVQSNIVVVRAGVPRNDPNVPELLVVNTTLGGGMTSRLFANLRETHGWTYGAYSEFAFKKLGGLFAASAEVRNEVTTPAIREILAELARISTTAIPDEELGVQRTYMVGNFLLSLEKPGVTAQRIQDIELYGLPTDYYQKIAGRFAGITPAAALVLARARLGENAWTVVVVGDAARIEKDLAAIGPVKVYDVDLEPR